MPIDVYAYSQGGVIARLALLELERRHGPAWVERFGLVAMLATPRATPIPSASVSSAGLSITRNLIVPAFNPRAGLVSRLRE